VNTRLIQLQQRIAQLETVAEEIVLLVDRYYRDDHSADSELSIKGQKWYRGSRELLAQNNISSLAEFEECYRSTSNDRRDAYYNLEHVLSAKDRRQIGMTLPQFSDGFRKCRALLSAAEDELFSRELPIVSQLSFVVASNELDTAEKLVTEHRSDDVMVRAAGVIGRVALERHLWTLAESRTLTIPKNPPTKKAAEVSDLLNALMKQSVITQVQRSQLDSLFTVANHCAHPKEPVRVEDVERLIREGRTLTTVIM